MPMTAQLASRTRSAAGSAGEPLHPHEHDNSWLCPSAMAPSIDAPGAVRRELTFMAGQVVYVDRFTIREDQLENFKRYAEEMSELVKAKEPEALSYHYYVDAPSG